MRGRVVQSVPIPTVMAAALVCNPEGCTVLARSWDCLWRTLVHQVYVTMMLCFSQVTVTSAVLCASVVNAGNLQLLTTRARSPCILLTFSVELSPPVRAGL